MPSSDQTRLNGPNVQPTFPASDAPPSAADDAAEQASALAPESASSQASLPVLLEDQPTVISKKPLSDSVPPVGHGNGHTDMGKTLVGQRLGHFELEEFVGGGGMGVVFRATDTMLGRTVAVKVLSRDQTDDETIRRFKNEALNAARLDHEKIARVYYVSEDQGWHYIVFEYIDGLNVRDLVQQRGPLALDEAVYYTLQVTEALRHAYRREVVHRDIKPSNIVVLADGRVKLVDMGLARHHQVDPDDDLTASGVTLGTFDYISPEQARDPRNADVRSDLYSLGCTLYFMLTGRPPFADGTVLQKLLSHSTDAPPDPRLYRPDVPDDICRIMAKTLAKNPAERYATPDDLIVELLEVADRLGLENSSKGAKWVSQPAKRGPWYEQHLPWLGPVVALVAIVVFLDWILAPPRDPGRPTPNLAPAIARTAAAPPAEKSSNKTDKKTTGEQTRGRGNNSQATRNADVPANTGETPAEEADPFANPDNVASAEKIAGNDGNAESVKPAVAPPIDTLIVSPSDVAHGPNALIVGSLAKALRWAAADYPDVKVIELAFDEKVEEPLDFDARAITIRAAGSHTPVIVFRPSADSYDDDHRLIRIRGDLANPATVKFERVQFRLELPKEHAGDGWSLLALEQQAQVRMDRCAMTIKNASDNGARLQEDVSFFAIIEPAATDTLRPAPLPVAMGRRALIDLEGVVARGEAAFVASQGTPFVLKWHEGLLATSGRMVEIAGAKSPPIGRVKLELINMTVDAHEGLCLLTDSDDAPHLVRFEVEVENCILLSQTGATLIEQHTLDSVSGLKASKKSHPSVFSVRSVFAGPADYWRIVSKRLADPEPTSSIALEPKALEYGLTIDYLENEVWWDSPAPLRLPHARTKADYILDQDPTNPALHAGVDPGFDPDASPDFARETPVAPAGSTAPTAPEKVRPTMPTLPEKMMMPIVPMEKMKPGDEQP